MYLENCAISDDVAPYASNERATHARSEHVGEPLRRTLHVAPTTDEPNGPAQARSARRILAAAFDLFLAQGVSATTIEDICERADVANRTFFNHFATRQDMMRALAERRLLNLHDVVFDRATAGPGKAGRPLRRHRRRRWSNPATPIAR